MRSNKHLNVSDRMNRIKTLMQLIIIILENAVQTRINISPNPELKVYHRRYSKSILEGETY